MNIFESIAAVQADVDFIGKDKQTTSGSRFNYRGVDQVLNTLHPLFAKHKVFVVPNVLEIITREQRKTQSGGEVTYQVVKVQYTFYAEDGTSLSAVVIGEAMDSGDKVSNKCMSVAYKYACFQVLSIPTEETTADPDDRDDDLAPREIPPKKEKQVAEVKTKALTIGEIRNEYGFDNANEIAEWICKKQAVIDLSELTEEMKKAARALLKKKADERKAEAERMQKALRESDEPLPFE